MVMMGLLLIAMAAKVQVVTCLAEMHKRVASCLSVRHHWWPIVLTWVRLLHCYEVGHVAGSAAQSTLLELIRGCCGCWSPSATAGEHKIV